MLPTWGACGGRALISRRWLHAPGRQLSIAELVRAIEGSVRLNHIHHVFQQPVPKLCYRPIKLQSGAPVGSAPSSYEEGKWFAFGSCLAGYARTLMVGWSQFGKLRWVRVGADMRTKDQAAGWELGTCRSSSTA